MADRETRDLAADVVVDSLWEGMTTAHRQRVRVKKVMANTVCVELVSGIGSGNHRRRPTTLRRTTLEYHYRCIRGGKDGRLATVGQDRARSCGLHGGVTT